MRRKNVARPTQEEIDARYEAAQRQRAAVPEGLPERQSMRPRQANPAKPMGSPRRRRAAAMGGQGGNPINVSKSTD